MLNASHSFLFIALINNVAFPTTEPAIVATTMVDVLLFVYACRLVLYVKEISDDEDDDDERVCVRAYVRRWCLQTCILGQLGQRDLAVFVFVVVVVSRAREKKRKVSSR